ncbi:peptide chain release factor N(5)-glutamine methyltransferase [Psychroflexus aestuariivivens]|uniref:peptide chain release factor N(5)-glutamine methyltransferase n=1 Tax=Psychroflexus aestuariivivens TaxID=1795040 RepID=UPI000FD9A099|nr:peptide chain release factor N(5)-glutamine methyltransferase [Psychroflexus aestuariivivens]
MTDLNKIKSDFFDVLKPIYEVEEINNFYKWLAEDLLNLSKLDLMMNSGVQLESSALEQFKNAQNRLQAEEPIQYILGYAEFFGLNFKVNPAVLIPRPETEELVEWILEDLKTNKNNLSILDLGTGSGCIPITLAKKLNSKQISALDISTEALELAKANAKLNQVQVEFFQADLLAIGKLPISAEILVSNPPYVKQDEKLQMQKNVLNNEPHLALFVENNDPLIFYRKIAELAIKSIKTEVIYLEINQYLAEDTKLLFVDFGFKSVELKKDFRGNFRMLKAFK